MLPGCMSTTSVNQSSGLTVETNAGRVKGYSDEGVLVFKGIPYGADTSGAARFLPPSPPAPWTGIRETLEYGYSSPQGLPASLRPAAPPPSNSNRPRSLISSGATGPGTSEDCLVLNVWTPAKDNGKRPVMVWLHGGGFSSGSGGSPWYDGTHLCQREDVVVVTINHRLNVFGYCYLDHLDEDFAGSSSAGMLDITLALKWVQDNISQFGGDPNRVMIFGESGGGRKTSVMMAFPEAKGLFHRAAVQSGSALRMDSHKVAAERTHNLFKELGLQQGDLKGLQNASMDDLLIASRKAARSQFRPVTGTPYLPHHPFDPGASDVNPDVPMLIGTCRTELSLFMGTDPNILSLDEAGLLRMTAGLTSEPEASSVVDAYKRIYPVADPTEILYRIGTDRGYFLDSTIQAARKADQPGASAYYYTFNRHTPVEGGRYITPHASEIPFVFHNLDEGANIGGAPTLSSNKLADQVSGAWAAFARTGNPNHAGLPDWPAYDRENRLSMILDEPECQVVSDPRSEERELMLSFGSQQYGELEPTPTGT